MKRFFALMLCLLLLLALIPEALAEEIRIVEPEEEDLIPIVEDEGNSLVGEKTMVVGNDANNRGWRLSWKEQSGATRYCLERSVNGGAYLDLVYTSNTYYFDDALLMGTTYDYKLWKYTGSWSVVGTFGAEVYNPFEDVSGKKTIDYIGWAYNNGVVTGTSGTTFAPTASCTRVQFVMMLWKMNGSPEVSGTLPFKDVSGTKTTKAVLWALKAGVIVSGKYFNPDDPITRVQIVMILWKMAGSPSVSGTLPFKDVSGDKTKKAVLWAYKNGITKGTSDTTFSPNKACTREQLVVFLYKFDRLEDSSVKYRALLVGEVHFSWETATRNEGDVKEMKSMLGSVKGAKGNKYSVTCKYDLSASGIKSAISSAFSGADENDVSLFFIATHGVTNVSSGIYAGELVTVESAGKTDGYLTLSDLASWLKKVPGKVIVVLGSCGSGAAIISSNGEISFAEGNSEEMDELFCRAAVEAFAAADPVANTGELRSSKFYVLTAAQHQESSWGSEYYHYNYFPHYFSEGAGSGKPADANGDGYLTLDELYYYSYERAFGPYTDSYGYNNYQHAMMYPEFCSYALFK